MYVYWFIYFFFYLLNDSCMVFCSDTSLVPLLNSICMDMGFCMDDEADPESVFPASTLVRMARRRVWKLLWDQMSEKWRMKRERGTGGFPWWQWKTLHIAWASLSWSVCVCWTSTSATTHSHTDTHTHTLKSYASAFIVHNGGRSCKAHQPFKQTSVLCMVWQRSTEAHFHPLLIMTGMTWTCDWVRLNFEPHWDRLKIGSETERVR